MRVLVIRHGAFGDIVLSFPAFAAIRAQHAADDITLLTTAPYAALLQASHWFDHVEIDARPKWWNLPGLWRLKAQLAGFDMVYDLQTSGRSGRYYTLAGRPVWSGIVPGCTYPDADNRTSLHTRERLEQQLALAGLKTPLPAPDLSWLTADISAFQLPARYVVLVPGAAPHRPEKRLPAETFHALVASLPAQAVVVGTKAEQNLAQVIGGIDLTGRTNFFQLAAVLRGACLVIGNDTGPMHLAAALGVRCLSLFSGASDPARTAPRYPDGGWPTILRAPSLQTLPVAQIRDSLP